MSEEATTRAAGAPQALPATTDRVTGVFHDPEAAEAAVRELVENHFTPEEVDVVVADAEGTREAPVEHRTGIPRGAAVGTALGALLGALVGALASTGWAGLDFALFATSLSLAALKGAVLGALVGFAVGVYRGMGSWHDEADVHVAGDEARARILVAVPATRERAERARRVLLDAGADAVQHHRA